MKFMQSATPNYAKKEFNSLLYVNYFGCKYFYRCPCLLKNDKANIDIQS